MTGEVAVAGPLEFGISVTPLWREQDELMRLVDTADEVGLDLVGIQDHPYQWRFHDTWTLLAFLAARTKRIRFFPDVANLPLRPPAVLGKAVASLDVLSGGRVELGVGAGGFPAAAGAMGQPEWTPRQAVQAAEEAIDVLRLMWSGERGLRYDGRHFRLAGVHSGPKPAHDIGIWVGARGPRMLDLIGRKADGWVPSSSWAPPEELAGYLDRIRSAAEEAGRDPAALRGVYNLMGTIGAQTGERWTGPVTYWVEELAQVVELGMDALVFWPTGDDPVGQVRTFAAEVAPAVRAATRRPPPDR